MHPLPAPTRRRPPPSPPPACNAGPARSEEHTSELQSQSNLVCRLLLEKKKNVQDRTTTRLKFIHRQFPLAVFGFQKKISTLHNILHIEPAIEQIYAQHHLKPDDSTNLIS